VSSEDPEAAKTIQNGLDEVQTALKGSDDEGQVRAATRTLLNAVSDIEEKTE
jgi:hypothetical protein